MKHIFKHLNRSLLLAGLMVAALAVGTVLAIDHSSTTKSKTAPAAKVQVDETPVPRQSGPYTSFAPVVKKVAPAVVKVVVVAKASRLAMPEILNDPFWRRFFGDQFNGQDPHRRFTPPRQRGLGSGVIVTKDGYILTNNHVVENAEEVKVTLHDGREFDAKVIGRDSKSDVAVIKIEAKDLPVLPMADSDKVQVGDIVLAVGNPFGVGQTVTTGIVSATGRGNLGIEEYEDFIQTDAAINPGNSGGALVDVEGRLIGINTVIFSLSGGNQGVGFAVPSDLVRSVMNDLIESGRVIRGYLGVLPQDVTPALARQFKLKDASGALLSEVVPKGPADKAGVKEGDVVTEFNGKKISDSRNFRLTVAATKPGVTVPVRILRDGSSKALEVTVQARPDTEPVAKNTAAGSSDEGTLNGVTVGDLDEQAREEGKVPANIKGVVITDVQSDCPAAEAGLKQGDIILEINRQPVRTAAEAVRLTEKPKDKVTLLRVWSNGGSHYVVVDESKAR